VLEVEADNKAAKLGIQQCKQKIKEQDQKDKTLYSNMFKKVIIRSVNISLNH